MIDIELVYWIAVAMNAAAFAYLLIDLNKYVTRWRKPRK